MQDIYYSRTSSSDTGLKILVVQSREPLYVFKSIKYLIVNPKTRNFFTFNLHKFKQILQV